MPTKFAHKSSSWNFFIKFFYYYAKVFGLVFFTISKNGRLVTSRKIQIVSILCRLCCLFSFAYYFDPRVEDVVLGINRMSMPIRVMATLQEYSVIALTLVCFVFQTIKQKQFIDIINRAIDIAYQISGLKKHSKVIGQEFCFKILLRFCCNISMIIAEFSRLTDAAIKTDFFYIGQCVLRFYVWFGTLIVMDLLCLGYVVAARMYQNIGEQLNSLAKRVERLENSSMTKFRRMQMLCDFSEELEKYAEIYSNIFKLTNEFHQLLQLYIFFMFCTDFVLLIGNIHHTFFIYMSAGYITWSLLIVSGIQAAQIVFYMLLLDKALKSSKIANSLNFDLTVSDVEPRWDKSVDQFLNQLRFQDLNLNIYGIFQLSNELLLQGFSATVSYLTILIQFQMLGYFKDGLYEVVA